MKILLPEKVKNIIITLNDNGFEAFAVGGCVRDSLLSITPNDWDICTSAKPEKIKECFKNFNTFDVGIKHGTISVVIEDEVFEITTYRIDGEYNDNRHPETVEFTDDIAKDLSRRDFTVNAMAYNDSVGLVDPFNGYSDLKSGILKTVRNPDERFNEDALRIIRALRFASTYNLKIEECTANSIHKNASLLSNIAVERISEEFCKLICGNGAETILNNYRDVFSVFIPEIIPMFDFDQHTKHHNRDLWHHTTHSVAEIEALPILRITMLLHDLGKPKSCKHDPDGTGHFKGHPKLSAVIAEEILKRLRFSTDFINDCVKLIIYHDVRFNGTKRQVKHIMNAISKENVGLLFKIQHADIMAQSDYKREEKLKKLEIASNFYNEIITDNECFTLKQLNVNGNDLKSVGIKDGKEIGRILKLLLSLVIDGKIENNKVCLIEKAIELKD